MAPRVQDVQTLLVTASIHGTSYNPVAPPTRTSISDIPRKERERLEIYGDAILRERVISFLFHEFTSRGAGFISTIQSALLSNATFTNILRKAQGYSHPSGFLVDKPIADDFETMAALSYMELPQQFEVWFCDTFVPLVNDAASLWDLADSANYEEYSKSAELEVDSYRAGPTAGDLTQVIPKRSWVESCIDAAQTTERRPSPLLRASKLPKRSRWDKGMDAPEEQRVRKRPWAEAMEAAGHDDRPPKSNWAAAMARVSELDTKTNNRHERNDKENCRPPSRIEPPRRRDRSGIHEKSDRLQPNPTTKEPLPRGPKRKSRWDVCVKDSLRESRTSEHQRSVASSATIREGNALRLWETNASVPPAPSCPPDPVPRPTTRFPASQTRHEPILSAPITSRLEEASERAALEPLHDVNTPAAASLALPLLDSCASTEMGCYDGARAGTCSPMEMSPASPTRFIPLPSCGNGQDAPPDLPTERAGSPAPFILGPPVMECESLAYRGGSGAAGRRRSDSLSSTASSMVISACSSPTRFIFETETPSVPSEKTVLCSPTHRGLVGGSEPSSEAHQGCSPTTPSASALAGTESENVVAHKSAFWPGQTLAFKYRQSRKPLRPIV